MKTRAEAIEWLAENEKVEEGYYFDQLPAQLYFDQGKLYVLWNDTDKVAQCYVVPGDGDWTDVDVRDIPATATKLTEAELFLTDSGVYPADPDSSWDVSEVSRDGYTYSWKVDLASDDLFGELFGHTDLGEGLNMSLSLACFELRALAAAAAYFGIPESQRVFGSPYSIEDFEAENELRREEDGTLTEEAQHLLSDFCKALGEAFDPSTGEKQAAAFGLR